MVVRLTSKFIRYFQFNGKKIKIFTTRPDTIFGATFCALSPFHPLIEELVKEEKDIENQVRMR